MSFLMFLPNLAEAEEDVQFDLVGLEIVKGIDIGTTRYGTRFIGKVFSDSEKIGIWSIVLDHKDFENIEVCGETGDVVRLRMIVAFTKGDYEGHYLVLAMRDLSGVPDVYWDFQAPLCFPLINGSNCVCPQDPEAIEPWNCDEGLFDGYGPIAVIPQITLKKRLGTTLNVVDAHLSGLLCHNYPLVPRVGGVLSLVLE